jgi:hypothetical protein
MALTDQDKLKQVSLLLADVDDLLAPLIGATQPHLGQFGGVIYRPTPLCILDAHVVYPNIWTSPPAAPLTIGYRMGING